jgi:hypothetical protein
MAIGSSIPIVVLHHFLCFPHRLLDVCRQEFSATDDVQVNTVFLEDVTAKGKKTAPLKVRMESRISIPVFAQLQNPILKK